MKKLTVDSKDINYIILDCKGKVIETGEKEEENDTFLATVFDLETVKVGKYPTLSFNKTTSTELAYKILKIEEYA